MNNDAVFEHLLSEVQGLRQEIKLLDSNVVSLKIDLERLKMKAGLLGVLAGAVPALISFFMK